MQLDDNFYGDIIEFIQNKFLDFFQNDILFIHLNSGIKHMGYFQIKYKILSKEFIIIFENDKNKFVIDIYDSENAKTSLYRISKFNNSLTKENVKVAIELLKHVLEEREIVFYIYKDNKLYKKYAGEYKRIKDLSEVK